MCLVERVSNGVIKLVDACPSPNRRNTGSGGKDWLGDLHPDKYWKNEKYYRVVFESRRLVRFVVLDVELCHEHDKTTNGKIAADKGECDTQTPSSSPDDERKLYTGPKSTLEKYALAEVEVARESDLGTTDETFHVITHLGNLLQTGDVVLGYDLLTSVMPGYDEMVLDSKFASSAFNSSFVLPDVVLVKKGKIGAVAEDGEDENGANDGEGNRAKSSGSKKRERRRRKAEKKAKALEETAVRMGFAVAEDDESKQRKGSNEEEEEEAFRQSELREDPDLAEELDIAEKILEASAAPNTNS